MFLDIHSIETELPQEVTNDIIGIMPESFQKLIVPVIFKHPRNQIPQKEIDKVYEQWKLRMYLLGKSTLVG